MLADPNKNKIKYRISGIIKLLRKLGWFKVLPSLFIANSDMNRKVKNRAMCGLPFSLPCLWLFLLVTYCLVLLFHKEILGCPSVCQLCTGRQINYCDLGLSSIPKNFPESTLFLYPTENNISHISESELIGLHSLVALYLDNTSIVYVYPKAFVHLQHLCFCF